MKFHKQDFRINYKNDTSEKVSGLVSGDGIFGIHLATKYVVTHIPTGFSVGRFRKERTARLYVDELSSFPIDWRKVTTDNIMEWRVEDVTLADLCKTIRNRLVGNE